jgi:hypothetical protein
MNDPTPTTWQPPASKPTDDIKQAVHDVRDAAGEQLSAVTDTARSALADVQDTAVEKTTELKGVAADEIARTAHGLEAAAAEMEGSPVQQDILREAADGLRHISEAMQGKSIGAMVGELSDFGRRNPVAYLGGAALAGFALARFARASAQSSAAERPQSFDPQRTGGASGWEAERRNTWEADRRQQDDTSGHDQIPPAPGGFTNG